MEASIDIRLTPVLRKQIEKDIALCDNHAERQGSEQLYSELVARYSVIDASFKLAVLFTFQWTSTVLGKCAWLEICRILACRWI